MAIIKDVEVEIISTTTGQALLEYDNHLSDALVAPMSVKKYVQATTDEEFHIMVKLREGFDFHGADGVRFGYNLDGDMLSRCKFFRRPDGVECLETAEILTIQSARVKIDGTWKRIRFSFGAVGVDEDQRTEKNVLDTQLHTLGNIHVYVERVKQHKRTCVKRYEGEIGTRHDNVDKKLLIQSISHTVKPARESSIAAPLEDIYKETRIHGKHGQPFKFDFRYRSYLGLQTLGCIQRTPSPVPLSERAPEDLTDEEKSAELARIRAELNNLRSQNRTLTQANQEMNKQIDEVKEIRERMAAFVGGDNSSPTKLVKRERVKEEKHDSEDGMGTPVGRRIKRAKTYDLTGDE